MEEKKYVYVDGKKTAIKDLTGQKFYRYEIIGLDIESYKRDLIRKAEGKIKKIHIHWLCNCDCGTKNKSVESYNLISGHTQSCGCYRAELNSQNNTERAINLNGSLGDWMTENLPKDFIILYWSNRNKISPFKMATKGNSIKMYIICDKCGEEYSAYPNDFVNQGTRCPNCESSKGEAVIKKFLDESSIVYDYQKKYDGLLGIKNGLLSYDFCLVDLNLLIEYQGEYHDGNVRNQTKEDFEKQQEHDKRKREYAKKHNIKLLEIWYWDFDNIEEILKRELKLN